MASAEGQRSEPADVSPQDAFLLYDGECPFCSLYARKSKFEAQIGQPLKVLDANQAPGLVDELRRKGCDIDEGMILVFDGRRHQGASAMMALETMTTGNDWFNRFARWFSSNPTRVRILYPWFRRLRGVALWVKGKSNPSRAGRN